MLGKILVLRWGYSMVMVSFYEVISETEKTVTVIEMNEREATEEEVKGFSKPAYLQGYSMPYGIKQSTEHRPIKPKRLSKRELNSEIVFRGAIHGSGSMYNLRVWSGKPVFYDHCD